MSDIPQVFHIGVNVFVVRGKKLLLGKRKNVYGAGTWGLPGGHLEFGEGMEAAARRELDEETGLTARTFRFSNIVNDKSRGEHYLQVAFVAEDVEGEPLLREPDRCEMWEWFDLDALPTDIFPAHVEQIKNFQTSVTFGEG